MKAVVYYAPGDVRVEDVPTPEHVRKAVELIAAGKVPADKLASHVLPLEGIFEAYELMKSGRALRVVLKP